ncbi:MAG: cupin domain-containing protein [Bilophila wadsworthia]
MPGFGGRELLHGHPASCAGENIPMHRLKRMRVAFYLGAPLRLAIVRPDGTAEEVLWGRMYQRPVPQYTVPGGCWFGATPAEGSDFALVGCTVAPGFDFDFEMADPDVLERLPRRRAGT